MKSLSCQFIATMRFRRVILMTFHPKSDLKITNNFNYIVICCRYE